MDGPTFAAGRTASHPGHQQHFGLIILCGGGHALHLGMVSGISGLYPVAWSILLPGPGCSQQEMSAEFAKCPSLGERWRQGALAQSCVSVGKFFDISEPDSNFVQSVRSAVKIA